MGHNAASDVPTSCPRNLAPMYRSVPNDNATAAIAVAFVRIEHLTTTTIALGGGGTRSSIVDFVDVETTAFPTALGRRMSG